MRRFALFCVMLAALTLSRGARAQRDEGRAEQLFAEAELADAAFDFPTALARYDEAQALDPGARFVPRAVARAAQLRAHAEGGFVPYARLERLRRDPKKASDEGAIDALVAESGSWPAGPTRVEAWTLAAEAYAHRLARPEKAIAIEKRILAEPGVDPVLARQSAKGLVDLYVARGDLAGAADAVRLAGANADPLLAREVARLGRRHWLHLTSIGVLVLLALASAIAAFKNRAPVAQALRKLLPLALAYAAYVGVTGGVLASGYEGGNARPFLFFGIALVPVLLCARAWAAAGSTKAAARGARAALACGAALGAAFLVIEGVDASYLDGLGL